MEQSTTNYTETISRVMEIEDLTWGDPKKDYLVRFRGRLTVSRKRAKDDLTAAFQAEKLSPILRTEDGRDVVLLISDPISSIVSQVFEIEDTMWGEPENIYLVRYMGRLTTDSVEAYDHLEEAFLPQNLTPLFRVVDDQQAIVLQKGVLNPRASNPWVNLALFILTFASMTVVGIRIPEGAPISGSLNDLATYFTTGLPFSLSLMAILLAHEFGHYIAARVHKTPTTLPYFLPLPLAPFGTLGAFIQLKSPPKNKRILHDIGISGPLAGLVVAIPLLIVGLSLSDLNTLPSAVPQGGSFLLEGNSIAYLFSKFFVFGKWLPAPVDMGGLHPFLYWLRFFFTGSPFPAGGLDVTIHPIALAGWGGLLVTALNLIPVGQLDGGHIIYVLAGKAARKLYPIILTLMIVLGLSWQGWWLFAVLLSFMGRTYAEPLDQITVLDPRRKAFAILGLVIFVLVFTPVPMQVF